MRLEDINFKNKEVVLRADFNVPISKDRKITSDARITASLPTLTYILERDPSRIVIISHLGRPKAGIPEDDALSLKPVYNLLANLGLKYPVVFQTLEQFQSSVEVGSRNFYGKIILLENIRYYPEETDTSLPGTKLFQEKLSRLGNVYVNDAFGCCHRSHSSIIGVRTTESCVGLLVQKELYYLEGIFSDNKGDRVRTMILGGSKVHDKIKLINNLLPHLDYLLIGGGMAFTFLKYLGYSIGNSLFDSQGATLVEDIIRNAKNHRVEILYPVDFICNNNFSNTGDVMYQDLEDGGITPNYMGLDIGENTITNFIEVLKKSDCIIWNGPVGVFEFDMFSRGSRMLMTHLAESKATTIIGGGDTGACCEQFGLTAKMDHVSTGGGAALELLEGKILPGLTSYFLTR